MSAPRQVLLTGSISGNDEAGRSFEVNFEGDRLSVSSQNVRAALAALTTLRALALQFAPGPSISELSWITRHIGTLRCDFQIGGHRVARAGAGARVNWLGRIVTRLPVELRLRSLLSSVFKAF